MKLKIACTLAILGSTQLVACQSPGAISEERPETARSDFEEQRARQVYDEYWQAQMEREEAMEAARERAREQQERRRDDR